MASREVRVAIIGDASSLRGALRESETGLTGFSQRMRRVGDRMRTAGRTMTRNITLPVVAIGGLAIRAAVDFESAFAGVRKTVDATEPQFAKLEQGIRDMAKTIPATAVEIAGVAEAAGQLGIAQEDILGFTRVMIDLGETTNLTAEEAATAMARFANVTGLPAEKFDELGSVIVDLGNNLATTESEIVEFATRLSGAGTQLGLTEADILAIGGAMSSVGIEAEAGGTAMSRIFNAMGQAATGNKDKLDAFASVAGTTADEFANMIANDPGDAIQAFVDGFGDLNANEQADALKDLGVGGERLLSSLQRLAGEPEKLAEALGLASDAWDENSALSDEAAQRYDTTAARLEVLRNKFTDVGISLGESLIPALETIADALEGAIEWFNGLSDSQQEMVKWAAIVAAAIGPLVWIFGGIATAIGLILTPVGLVILAIAALAAGVIYAYTQWDWFREAVDGAWQSLQVAWDVISDGAIKAWHSFQDLWQAAQDVWDVITTGAVDVWHALQDVWQAAQRVWDILTRIAVIVWHALYTVVSTLVGWLDSAWEAASRAWDIITRIGSIALGVVLGAASRLKGLFDQARTAAGTAWETIRNLGSAGLGGLLGAIGSVVSRLAEATGLAATLNRLLDGAGSKQGIAIPKVDGPKASFTGGISEGGTTLVGESGPELAFLPKGTRVRTASRTKNAMTAGGAGVTPDDIRRALSGMRFEVGDGFVTMVEAGLRSRGRAAA